MQLRIHRLLSKTKTAGPGLRFCIWVQGCSRECKGCAAKHTWSHEGGTLINVDMLLDQILHTEGISGITFLGGEPFEQAKAVSTLAAAVRKHSLSVVTFTGFTYKELLSCDCKYVKQLACESDLLIDGPFNQVQFDLSRPWVGSANQQYWFLSDRYSKNDVFDRSNQIEIRIDQTGQALINGMGDFSKIRALL